MNRKLSDTVHRAYPIHLLSVTCHLTLGDKWQWGIGPGSQTSTHPAAQPVPIPPLIQEKTGGTRARKLSGPNKDKEISHQLLSQGKHTHLGESDLI